MLWRSLGKGYQSLRDRAAECSEDGWRGARLKEVWGVGGQRGMESFEGEKQNSESSLWVDQEPVKLFENGCAVLRRGSSGDEIGRWNQLEYEERRVM